MKVIKSTVTYVVPHWNFCNVDTLDISATVPKETCKFCVKGRCLLYNATLTVDGEYINKTRECCKATAGFKSEINSVPPPAPTGPTVKPKELMRHTIDVYIKTVNDLVAQGYPESLATSTAKKYVLGEK